MFLKEIYLKNFRNYHDTHINFDGADSIFLIGKNGQGKTNFLESLYYLSYGNSFKSKKEDHVVQHGEQFYRICGIFEENEIEKKIEITYANKTKKIELNDTQIKNRKEMLNNFPTLIFKHSDIFFVSGSPEYQRQYLDQILVLNHSEYTQAFQNYKKVLSFKNTALKQANYEMLSIYNEQLVDYGMLMITYRKIIVDYINSYLETMFSYISDESISMTMEYIPNWSYDFEKELSNNKDFLINKMKLLLEQEKRYKTSLSGPHRDLTKIMIFDNDFKQIASTGQIRLISLLLRSLQANYYYKEHKKPMIYLFDDVLLEVDVEKQKRYLQYLPEAQQTFFTFLPEEKLPNMIRAHKKKFFNVVQGDLYDNDEVR